MCIENNENKVNGLENTKGNIKNSDDYKKYVQEVRLDNGNELTCYTKYHSFNLDEKMKAIMNKGIYNVIKNIDTGGAQIAVYDAATGALIACDSPAGFVSRNRQRLATHGIVFTKDDIDDFESFLMSLFDNDNYCKSNYVLTAGRTGFTEDACAFKSLNSVIVFDAETDKRICCNSNFETTGFSETDLRVTGFEKGPWRKGSEDEFRNGLIKLVYKYNKDGSEEPQLPLIFALSLNIYGVIRQLFIACHRDDCAASNIVVNFAPSSEVATSSIGKTTATSLANVMYGKPERLMTNFNTTVTKIDSIMGEHYVIPSIFDDLIVGKARGIKVVELILRVVFGASVGKTKSRYYGKAIDHFSPAVISTESSLAEKFTGSLQEGQLARLVEIVNTEEMPFTQNAEHADAIKKFCRDNNGFIVEIIKKLQGETEGCLLVESVEERLDTAKKIVSEIVNDRIEGYIDSTKENEDRKEVTKEVVRITYRWTDNLSLIALCCQIMEEYVFGLGADYARLSDTTVKVVNFLIDNIIRSVETHLGVDKMACAPIPVAEAVTRISVGTDNGMIVEGQDAYAEKMEHDGEGDETWGFFETDEAGNKKIFINGETNMRKVVGVENAGKEDFRALLRNLNKAGYLEDGERANSYETRRYIKGTRKTYYIFNINWRPNDGLYKS